MDAKDKMLIEEVSRLSRQVPASWVRSKLMEAVEGSPYYKAAVEAVRSRKLKEDIGPRDSIVEEAF